MPVDMSYNFVSQREKSIFVGVFVLVDVDGGNF